MLREALGKARWPAGTRLVPEPVAAAGYFAEVLRRPVPAGSSLAVFDFGAGTLDVTVVRNDGPEAGFTVTASGGADDLGGLDLDAALVDHLGKTLAGAEPDAWHLLTEPVTLGQWRARRQFWEDVRGAKEMLSRSAFAPVPIPGVEHAVELTRAELEAVVDPLVRRGVAEAAEVIEAAGLSPDQLAGLFLVGGSTRVPMVARLLHAGLGIAPTVLEQPELPVAEGAISERPVRYAAGPAVATTPARQAATPITDTRLDDLTDERLRATPVDPWATGEAAALPTVADPLPDMDGGWASPPGGPVPTTPPGSPVAGATTPPAAARRRGLFARPYMMILAGGVTVALAAAAWVFWPRSVDFHPLSEPRRIAPVVPVGSDWSDAEIIGDRAYFASSSMENGAVGVVAMDIGASKPAWTSTKAGTATRWTSMVALPVGIALFTDTDSLLRTRRVVVLGAENGDLRWQRTIGGDDEVFFAGDTAVVSDRAGKRLLGLDVADGSQRWSRDDPRGTASIAPAVLAVTAPTDLRGPARLDLGDDPRIVEVGADKSVVVLNAGTGKAEKSRQNVADPDDEMVAHNGRLLVLQPDDQRVVSYDLDQLGEPRVLYTAQGRDVRLTDGTPCGDDRVCFAEETGYDSKTDKVVALDVAKGKRLWDFPVSGIDTLVPVGEAVLATSAAGETTLIDGAGKRFWTRKAAAGRLDGNDLLEFSKPLSGSPDNPALAGRHLGNQAVPLGYLSDIRSETCSWNISELACVAEKDFVLQEFAD